MARSPRKTAASIEAGSTENGARTHVLAVLDHYEQHRGGGRFFSHEDVSRELVTAERAAAKASPKAARKKRAKVLRRSGSAARVSRRT
jgi:hypothetical protein